MKYYTYSYGSMKPKPDKLKRTWASTPGSYTYESWKSKLEGSSAKSWQTFCEQFAEDFQFALLLGITVRGLILYDWDDVFRAVCQEYSPFQGFTKMYWQGQLKADWRYFTDKLAEKTSESLYYPTLYPEWLFPYGYIQKQYLQDLAVYWDNLADEYYQVWPDTQLGQDSPEIARLRKLGEAARREIDDVAKHSGQYSKR